MHVFKIVMPEHAYQCGWLVKSGLAPSHKRASLVDPVRDGAAAQVCGMGQSRLFVLPLPKVLPSARVAPGQIVGIVVHPRGWCDGCSWVWPAT